MEIEAIVALIESGMPGCQASVTGDGRHFEAIVISEEFEGKSPLQKQRMVMATVKAQLESDQLHALSIKTYTKEQWQTLQG